MSGFILKLGILIIFICMILNNYLWKKQMKKNIDDNLLKMKMNGRTLEINTDYYNGNLIFTEKNIDSISITKVSITTFISKKAEIEFNVKIIKDAYCFEVPVSMTLKYNENIDSRWELTDGIFENNITLYKVQ